MSEILPRSSNKLLSALPISIYQRLELHLEVVSLVKGQNLYQNQEQIQDIYFPENALISWVLMLSDKSTTELGAIGKEGFVGLSTILGGTSTNNYFVVQISGVAVKLPTAILKQEFDRGEAFHNLLLLYARVQLSQVSQIAACNTHHNIEQRVARRLLLIHDRLETETIPLTQQSIAQMLGVRRASVTEVALSLQKAGIINYSRGQISLLDLPKLELVACECYDVIKKEYSSLLAELKRGNVSNQRS